MNPNTISKIFRIPEKLKISLLCVILETQYGGTLIYFSESHSFKYVSMSLTMCYDYQSIIKVIVQIFNAKLLEISLTIFYSYQNNFIYNVDCL